MRAYREYIVGLIAALAMMLPPGGSRAEIDLETSALPTGEFQLVVMEADGCIYCGLFRRDVLPAYETSEQGRQMPVRFIDVNDVDKSALDLNSPVEIVPTFIVVKERKEIGRISGYMGPENFYHSINYLLSSAP